MLPRAPSWVERMTDKNGFDLFLRVAVERPLPVGFGATSMTLHLVVRFMSRVHTQARSATVGINSPVPVPPTLREIERPPSFLLSLGCLFLPIQGALELQ